jgi:hypothetical protein
MSRRVFGRMLVLAAVAATTAACLPPGAGTLFEKGVAEVRGGWGEARESRPFPPGPVMDRFRSVKVARVDRSPDAGPMPADLPKIVETELRNALRDANLFAGGAGPTLVIRARLTNHWRNSGFSTATGGPSEVVARIEFLEEGRSAPLGVYYVRGISTALARNSDENLGRGLAEGVIEVIESRRTPSQQAESPFKREPL